MKNNRKRFLSCILFLTFVFALASSSAAGEIEYLPKLELFAEYNDNIFYSNTDKTDDLILNAFPSIELKYASELMDLYSFFAVVFRDYLSENDSDREDYHLNLDGKYRLTERTLIRTWMSYSQDYANESRVVDLVETPVDEVPIDEEKIVRRGIERFLSERKLYNAFGSANHQLTYLSDLIFTYSYLKAKYDSEGNVDYYSNEFDLTYLRKLASIRDQVGISLSYTQIASNSSDSDTYETGLVWNHLFTETISLYVNLGASYTEQTDKDTRRKSDYWGPTANIRLRKRGETNVLDIGFRQELSTASDGDIVNVSRIFWDAEHSIGERIFFKLEGDFYITRDEADAFSDIDSIYFGISPSLKYMLTENHSVSLVYDFTINYDKSLDTDRDTQRNRVLIVFDFLFPGWKFL